MSRIKAILGLVFLGLVLIWTGCDSGREDTSGLVRLEGQVLDADTNDPIDGALIQVSPLEEILETDATGRFDNDVEIDSTQEITLTASKVGFNNASVSLLVLAGRTITVPVFRLQRVVTEGPISGKASNILLAAQSTEVIGIKESGSEEVAEITFQVADSLGRAINLDNVVNVNFSLGDQPGGGEFIFPTVAQTDNNGVVKVNLSSGTRAGTVQIVARTEVDGRQIRSLPVTITIHGGLPHQDHFTIGPARFNFPGLRRFGIINPIAVIVADQYFNPVKPRTAVYFTTTYGVMVGSTSTDNEGRGVANLISGNPLPPDGIAVITGSTADENQEGVSGQTPVVFSGYPTITVVPGTAILGQTYQLTVDDQNGNPLVESTGISVSADGTNVKAVGNIDVTLDDTAFSGGMAYENVVRGPGITEFIFSAVSALDEELENPRPPELEAIVIKVSGENGNLEIVLPRAGEAFARTKGATRQFLVDGAVQFSAPVDQ